MDNDCFRILKQKKPPPLAFNKKSVTRGRLFIHIQSCRIKLIRNPNACFKQKQMQKSIVIFQKKDRGLRKCVYFWISRYYALNLYVILTCVFILKTRFCLYTYSNFINDILHVLYSVQIRHIQEAFNFRLQEATCLFGRIFFKIKNEYRCSPLLNFLTTIFILGIIVAEI